MNKDPQKPDLRAKALAYLARREYSRAELQHKLNALTEDGSEVEAVLDDLTKRKLLSEARFVEQVVHARQSKFGSRRIQHELREKGVSEAAIEHAVADFKLTELDNARAVWQKKFGELPTSASERAKQMRFMQSRGFSSNVIFKLISRKADDDQ
ncbi:MAG: recombination regulator RecX [Burkholderiales bacterium]